VKDADVRMQSSGMQTTTQMLKEAALTMHLARNTFFPDKTRSSSRLVQIDHNSHFNKTKKVFVFS